MLPVLSQAPKGRQMLGDTEGVFRAHLSEAVRGPPLTFVLPVLSQAPKGRQMLGDTERVFRAHLSEAVRGHPVMFTAVTTLDVTSVACPCGMQGIIVSFFVAFNTCASFSAMRALV